MPGDTVCALHTSILGDVGGFASMQQNMMNVLLDVQQGAATPQHGVVDAVSASLLSDSAHSPADAFQDSDRRDADNGLIAAAALGRILREHREERRTATTRRHVEALSNFYAQGDATQGADGVGVAGYCSAQLGMQEGRPIPHQIGGGNGFSHSTQIPGNGSFRKPPIVVHRHHHHHYHHHYAFGGKGKLADLPVKEMTAALPHRVGIPRSLDGEAKVLSKPRDEHQHLHYHHHTEEDAFPCKSPQANAAEGGSGSRGHGGGGGVPSGPDTHLPKLS